MSKKTCHTESLLGTLTWVLAVGIVLSGVSAGSLYANPASTEVSTEGQDVEVVLNTLNEVLEENRKMRQELEEHKRELSNAVRENSSLKNQVTGLTKDRMREEREVKMRTVQLEKEVNQKDRELGNLRRDYDNLKELRSKLEKSVASLEAEISEKTRVLDQAILETERVEYLNLIENAQGVAQHSVHELSSTNRENEMLKTEVAESYYKVGNLLFDLRDYDNAASAYKKAVRWNPLDSWSHHNLGIIYDYYLYDNANAIYHYNKFLNYKNAQDEAGQIRERVLQLELKKNLVPHQGVLKGDYNAYTTKRLR